MPYKASAIANYFIDRAKAEGKALSPMKVQKLVYYAHGWHLAITGQPLIDEQVEAWKFGPVIRSLYRDLRDYGAGPIPEKIKHHTMSFGPDGEWHWEHNVPEVGCGEGDSYTRQLLERIWSVYGGYSAVQLSNMTHEPLSPWYKIHERSVRENGELIRGTDIPADAIKTYFESLAKR